MEFRRLGAVLDLDDPSGHKGKAAMNHHHSLLVALIFDVLQQPSKAR
jgi:hypothetical protein